MAIPVCSFIDFNQREAAASEKRITYSIEVQSTNLTVWNLKVRYDVLRRYKYCTIYGKPLLEDCQRMLNVDLTDVPEKFPVFYLTQKQTKSKQLIQEIDFIPTEEERFYKEINQARPVVVVVKRDETEILEELRDVIKHKIICLVLKQSQEGKEKSTRGKPFGDHIVVYTSKENLMDDMDKALERYVFSFLNSALNTLKLSESCKTNGQSIMLQESIHALLNHSERLHTSTSKIQDMEFFSEINKVSFVLGCGFCRDTLHVFVDEECDNRDETKRKLEETIKQNGVKKFAFRFVRSEIVKFATSGDTIKGIQRGTLSGFAKTESGLFALTAKHVAGQVGQSCYTADGHKLGQVVKVSDKMDLAVAQVDEPYLTLCDLSLKDECGNSLEIPCTVHNDVHDLQDLLVYIRGAETKLGRGRIVIPFLKTLTTQHIVITNFSSDIFSKEGDSGALVLGRARENKNEVWAIGTIVGKYTSREDEAEGNIYGPQFLAVGLQAGLDDLSTDEPSAFELAIQRA